MSIERITQGDPLLMVFYGITLAPLAEELRAADQGLLSLFYADDVEFDGSVQRSAQLLKLLMKRAWTRDISLSWISPSLSWTTRAKRRRQNGSLRRRSLF